MKQVQKKIHVIFDSNFRGNVFLSHKNYTKFRTDFDSHKKNSPGIGYFGLETFFLETPFSFIEAAGITLRAINRDLNNKIDFRPLSKTEKGSKAEQEEINRIITILYDLYFNQINNAFFLQKKYIKRKLWKSYNYVRKNLPDLKKTYKQNYIDQLGGSSDIEWIHQSLVLDRILSHDFPKSLKEREIIFNMITAIKFIQSRRNNSFARAVFKFWNDYFHQKVVKGIRAQGSFRIDETDVARINKALNLKPLKDLLDTDIIHLACVGRFTENEHLNVSVITCDSFEDTIIRVGFYKTAIVHMNSIMRDELKLNESIICKEGWILISDIQTGAFTHIIEVAKVPPLFDFLDKNDLNSFYNLGTKLNLNSTINNTYP